MKFFSMLLVTLVVFVAVVEAAKPGTKKPSKKPVTAAPVTTCSSDYMCQNKANKRSICKYELCGRFRTRTAPYASLTRLLRPN